MGTKHIAMTPTELSSTFHETGVIVWFAAKAKAPKSEFPMTPKDMRRPGDKAPLIRGVVAAVDARRGTFRGESDHGLGSDIKIENCVFMVEAL